MSMSPSHWRSGAAKWMPVVFGVGYNSTRPELNKRCQPHLKRTNKSYRVDETYIKVKRHDKYLYRAVDSTGQTIDFLLSARRDTAAAKRFFEKVLSSSSNSTPRVINVDKNTAYSAAVEALKDEANNESYCLSKDVFSPAEFVCAVQVSQQCD
jgi:transposase-like protein